MNMEWIPFDQEKWAAQPLPPKHKRVLLAFAPEALGTGSAAATAVGYLKFGAGDPNSPYFVIPGVGGKPSHWCDCLPDNFGEADVHPHWKFPPRKFPPRLSVANAEVSHDPEGRRKET